MIASREICKLCYSEVAVGFAVPDDIWKAAVPAWRRDDILCLSCFTRLADAHLVPWDRDIEFFPVSLAAHLGVNT